MTKGKKLSNAGLAFLLLNGLWYLASVLLKQEMLPSPVKVYQHLFQMKTSPPLLSWPGGKAWEASLSPCKSFPLLPTCSPGLATALVGVPMGVGKGNGWGI